MEAGENMMHYLDLVQKKDDTRSFRSSSPTFKANRLILKQQRASLRHCTELSEGITYQSNMGLINTSCQKVPNEIGDFNNDNITVVYFDLETSGFGNKSEILQIAAQCSDKEFSSYAHPTKKICLRASEANGLTCIEGNLLYNGIRVESQRLKNALIEFYNFLTTLNQKSILCAHNCTFDCRMLVNSVKKFNLQEHCYVRKQTN